MLDDLKLRILRINRTADQWDERIAQAGESDDCYSAGRLLDAAERDFARWDFWQDPKTNRTAEFSRAEEAVEYLGDRLQEIAVKISEEWGDQYRPGGQFTKRAETKWILREISDALSELISGVAK